jgi:hypothetical protein
MIALASIAVKEGCLLISIAASRDIIEGINEPPGEGARFSGTTATKCTVCPPQLN